MRVTVTFKSGAQITLEDVSDEQWMRFKRGHRNKDLIWDNDWSIDMSEVAGLTKIPEVTAPKLPEGANPFYGLPSFGACHACMFMECADAACADCLQGPMGVNWKPRDPCKSCRMAMSPLCDTCTDFGNWERR